MVQAAAAEDAYPRPAIPDEGLFCVPASLFSFGGGGFLLQHLLLLLFYVVLRM